MGTLPSLLGAADAPLLGLPFQCGQIGDGPDRPPSQLPPPLGLLATLRRNPPLRLLLHHRQPSAKHLPRQLFLQDPRKPAQNQVKSHSRSHHGDRKACICVLQERPEPSASLSLTCGRGIHASLTSPRAFSSDPERHCASVSGDGAVSSVSWRPSWKELSLLTTVLLLGSRWISGGQAYRLPTPATGTHSQKCNRGNPCLPCPPP